MCKRWKRQVGEGWTMFVILYSNQGRVENAQKADVTKEGGLGLWILQKTLEWAAGWWGKGRSFASQRARRCRMRALSAGTEIKLILKSPKKRNLSGWEFHLLYMHVSSGTDKTKHKDICTSLRDERNWKPQKQLSLSKQKYCINCKIIMLGGLRVRTRRRLMGEGIVAA